MSDNTSKAELLELIRDSRTEMMVISDMLGTLSPCHDKLWEIIDKLVTLEHLILEITER